MKMWAMKVTILLLFCYACHSTGNESVYFISRNFNNTLHWHHFEPDFPEEEVFYSVQYRSDLKDYDYQIKEECQNITALTCDLTAETPSILDVHYMAQVFANGHLLGRTNTFKPIAETVLSEPMLNISTMTSSLHINVTLPLGPNGKSIADIFNSSKRWPSIPSTYYILVITQPKWAAQSNKTENNYFVINLKNNHTEYCGYVVYMPNSEWGRSPSQKALFCATLKEDPWILLPWLLMSATILTIIAIVSVVYMCRYIKGGKGKDMARDLVNPSGNNPVPVLQSPDADLIISVPVVCTQIEQMVYSTIMVQPRRPSTGIAGYSPQDIICQVMQGDNNSCVSTGLRSQSVRCQDTSTQSSEIYGAVAVHVSSAYDDFHKDTIKDQDTCRPLRCNIGESCANGGTSPKLISHDSLILPNLDDYENDPGRPLLLKTMRDNNGKLILSTLTHQLQSSKDRPASPVNVERKLQLSDLTDSNRGMSVSSLHSTDSSEWTDSGWDESTINSPVHFVCKTNYFPNQLALPDFNTGCMSPPTENVIIQSAYKQNWIPAVTPEKESEDICNYSKTNTRWL
ncbi:uncharacterized protein LOC117513877 [Thalassophryne amazonica]|uniref:uncharacterized protein LOC117513877 n=1 Tax=Thalassophryne amazonica TaxID=390379 RepID=UPI001470D231|nr:uncharacterized protein LOC117513877 [Thalassophryne amazonica]